jgi:hypothetical protein
MLLSFLLLLLLSLDKAMMDSGETREWTGAPDLKNKNNNSNNNNQWQEEGPLIVVTMTQISQQQQQQQQQVGRKGRCAVPREESRRVCAGHWDYLSGAACVPCGI